MSSTVSDLEQGEVAVPGEQLLDAVGHAQRRHPRVVNDPPSHPWPVQEAGEPCAIGGVPGAGIVAPGGREVSLEDTVVALLREQVLGIAVGTAFVVVGLAAFVVAAARRRSGVRALAWLGAWSATYGAQELCRSTAAVASLPAWLQGAVPHVSATLSYLLLVVGALVWLELTRGAVRRLLVAGAATGLAIAVAGVGWFVLTGEPNALSGANSALAVLLLLLLVTVVAVPRLAERYLVLPHRGVLLAGTLAFALQALYANVARPLGYPSSRLFDWLGFAALILSFGYVALQSVLAGERRLLSIESELGVARRLQLGSLPGAVPRLDRVRVAAVYEPMTAVAGDFYEFVPGDAHRAGFLVADVSGHGVPAALVASTIKVAMRSAAERPEDPSEVLRRLGAALHLRGQYVTAAYLWLDTESGVARYSAAGHPPLVLWRAARGEVVRIESNGMLFGVVDHAEYPTRDVAVEPGDRFLLYTDGLTEPENGAGEPFGDARLDEVLRECRSATPEELSRRLLAEVAAWRPRSVAQQDDITVLVVDLLGR
jgi:sigma-B regulation protein RsbU (phosphoserine phosphatase)